MMEEGRGSVWQRKLWSWCNNSALSWRCTCQKYTSFGRFLHLAPTIVMWPSCDKITWHWQSCDKITWHWQSRDKITRHDLKVEPGVIATIKGVATIRLNIYFQPIMTNWYFCGHERYMLFKINLSRDNMYVCIIYPKATSEKAYMVHLSFTWWHGEAWWNMVHPYHTLHLMEN